MKINSYKGRRRRRWWILPLILALLAGGCLWLHWQLWGVEATVSEVSLSALPEGFEGYRILHLSDLHGHEYGADSEKLLALAAEQEPELIVLTGDLIDQSSQLAVIPALAKGLSAIAPTYYVTGNHEWAAGGVRELKELLEACGVTVLTNRFLLLERGGDSLVLCGVDDPNGPADQKTPEELCEEIGEAYPDQFTLLLAHRSDLFPRYAAAGYDLVLSGHAHGGIVRLPFTDGLLGTDRRLFPTYTSGAYTEGESTLFVSRGLGNNTTPIRGLRLFNRPEAAVVILHTK